MSIFSSAFGRQNSLMRLQRNLQGVGFPGLWRDLTHVVVEQAFGRTAACECPAAPESSPPFIIASIRCTGGSTASGEVILLPFSSSSQLCAVRQLFVVVTQRHADRFIAFVKHQTGAIRVTDACAVRLAVVSSAISAVLTSIGQDNL